MITPDGRERNKSFRTKTAAEAYSVTTDADVRRGVFVDAQAGKVTLARYAQDWLAAQRQHQASTRESVEQRLRVHIFPVLGGYTLGQLASRPSLVQAWVKGLPASGNHAKAIYTTLATVLNSAVADKLIPSNPCHGANIRRTRPRPGSRKIVPWSAGQVDAVRGALPSPYQVLVDLDAGLGLRQGEIFGLALEDIDFLRRVVHVRRQVRIVGARLVFAPPKRGKERDVPLPGRVALALAAHLESHPARPVTLPWEEPGGKPVTAVLVLRSPTGLAINRNSFNVHAWKPALQEAGITPSRENGCHALRHYFASVLLFRGVDIRALSEYLGHDDPGFTLRVYSHLMPGAADKMRQAIDDAYAQDHGPATAQGGAQ